MTQKLKGRSGGDRPTLKTSDGCNYTEGEVTTEADFASFELIPDTVDWNVLYGDDSIIPERARNIVKTIIVRLALKGWIPYRLAEVLIQRGGLRHV